MIELQAIEAIYLRLADGWTALHPSDPSDPNHVPYCLENELYSKDVLGVLGAWIRMSIIWTGGEQLTQGAEPNRKWERRGAVFVQIFGPPNQGVGLLARLASDVRTVFEGKRVDDLNFHEGATGNVNDKGDWATRTVTVRFSFEETR